MGEFLMAKRIRVCPFCGHWAVLGNNESDEDYNAYFPYFQVVCDFNKGGCGASGGFRKTIDEAIDAWNERVDDVVLDEE